MEIWKKIDEYPGYEVSNYGNVKSFKYKEPRILKPAIGMKGYFYVNLCRFDKKYKKHYLHRLVSSSFIRRINSNEQIDHRDSNKLNNKLENLDIVDNRINQLRNKRSVLPGAHKDGDKYRSRIQINGEIIYVGRFNTAEEAHEAYKNKLKEHGINIDFDKDFLSLMDDK